MYGVVIFFIFLSEFLVYKKFNPKLIYAGIGGVIFGLIFHPYPKDYIFYHLVNALFWIPYYRFTGKVPLGAELYSEPDLFINSIPFFFVLLFSIFLFFTQRKLFQSLSRNVRVIILSLGFLVILTFLFTLVSSMLICYLVPVGILFSALIIKYLFRSQYFLPITDYFKNNLLFKIAVIFLCLILFFNFCWKTFVIVVSYSDPILFQEGANWLKDNTPYHSIIFTSSWGYFPILFFYNTHNYYLFGLDPAGFYQYNHKLFYKWNNLTRCGIISENPEICSPFLKNSDREELDKFQQTTSPQDIYNLIKNEFQSHYIFTITDKKEFIKRLDQNDQLFILKYQNNFVKIYELK